MKPEIKFSPQRLLVGKHLRTTLSQNNTYELWRSFMPRRKEIKNNINTELISVEIYEPTLKFENFDQNTIFQKWAAVEVSHLKDIPEGMDILTIPEGAYVVFIHNGTAPEGIKTFNFIFKEWLPSSEYDLDQRPHFEIMGKKYKQDDPDSEEEFWVPVKKKTSPQQV